MCSVSAINFSHRGQPLAGVGFDTPTLYGSWSTSAFFHNGQAATLQALFATGHGNASSLPAADVTALVRVGVRSQPDPRWCIAVDLVIGTVLMALGMQMVSPHIVSIP